MWQRRRSFSPPAGRRRRDGSMFAWEVRRERRKTFCGRRGNLSVALKRSFPLTVCACYFNKYPRLRLFHHRMKSVKTLLIESRKQRGALYGGQVIADTLFIPSQLVVQVLDRFWDRHEQDAASDWHVSLLHSSSTYLSYQAVGTQSGPVRKARVYLARSPGTLLKHKLPVETHPTDQRRPRPPPPRGGCTHFWSYTCEDILAGPHSFKGQLRLKTLFSGSG